jgi:multiple sugar transport system permease protein
MKTIREAGRRIPLEDMPLFWFMPAIFILLIVTVYPLLYVVWMSFQETRYYDLVGFVGLKNYINVFTSTDFRDSSFASVVYLLGSLALAIPFGLLAAIVFNELGRFASAFRVLTLLPWTLSMGVVASLWLWLLNPTYGPISYFMQSMGLSPGLMLGDPDVALWLLIVATAWWSFPYAMVIVTAALQSIPSELYEAVEIDGGGVIARFRYVTWPFLAPTLGSIALNLAILYLTVVTLILMLTGGGPLGSTATWSFEVFRGTIQTINIAPAAVYSIVVFIVNLLIGVVYVRLTGRVTG